MIAAGTAYAAGRQHDSFLHLLFDVRLPARRGLHLGGGRCTHEGLPAWRHGRPHHAGRRRFAASGRSEPCAGAVSAHLPFVDPAFAFELAAIVQDGIKRMYIDGEDAFYYITVMNEQYEMPPMPAGVHDGIIKGALPLQHCTGAKGRRTRPSKLRRSCWATAPSSTRQSRRRGCSRPYGRGSGCLERDQLQRSIVTATPPIGGTGCIPPRSRGPVRHRVAGPRRKAW